MVSDPLAYGHRPLPGQELAAPGSVRRQHHNDTPGAEHGPDEERRRDLGGFGAQLLAPEKEGGVREDVMCCESRSTSLPNPSPSGRGRWIKTVENARAY